MIVKQKKLCNAFFRVTMEKEDDKWRIDVSAPLDTHGDSDSEERVHTYMPCLNRFAAWRLYRRLKDGGAVERIIYHHEPNYFGMYDE